MNCFLPIKKVKKQKSNTDSSFANQYYDIYRDKKKKGNNTFASLEEFEKLLNQHFYQSTFNPILNSKNCIDSLKKSSKLEAPNDLENFQYIWFLSNYSTIYFNFVLEGVSKIHNNGDIIFQEFIQKGRVGCFYSNILREKIMDSDEKYNFKDLSLEYADFINLIIEGGTQSIVLSFAMAGLPDEYNSDLRLPEYHIFSYFKFLNALNLGKDQCWFNLKDCYKKELIQILYFISGYHLIQAYKTKIIYLKRILIKEKENTKLKEEIFSYIKEFQECYNSLFSDKFSLKKEYKNKLENEENSFKETISSIVKEKEFESLTKSVIGLKINCPITSILPQQYPKGSSIIETNSQFNKSCENSRFTAISENELFESTLSIKFKNEGMMKKDLYQRKDNFITKLKMYCLFGSPEEIENSMKANVIELKRLSNECQNLLSIFIAKANNFHKFKTIVEKLEEEIMKTETAKETLFRTHHEYLSNGIYIRAPSPVLHFEEVIKDIKEENELMLMMKRFESNLMIIKIEKQLCSAINFYRECNYLMNEVLKE